jgi:hypothetical protein
MFTFIRIAKAHPKLKTLSAIEAAQLIRRELAAAEIDIDLGIFDSVDPAAEIASTWDRIYPIDGGPLSLAWLNAMGKPVAPLKTISPKYTQFLSIAYHLQINGGSAAILLPVAKLAKMLGVNFRTISFYRKIAIAHRLLEATSDYSYSEKRAAEFFFNVRLFDRSSLVQIAHWNQDKQDYQDKQDIQDKQDKQNKQDYQEVKILTVPSKAFPSFAPTEAELQQLKEKALEVAKRYA